MVKTSDNGPPEEDRPVGVEVSNGMLHVTLKDGRAISTPLEWYPRLAGASEAQVANVELGTYGIHWPDLDEDLSVRGMLEGIRPPDSTQAAQRENVA
jgi:hypothetical protein